MEDTWRFMPENPMNDWNMGATPIMVCPPCTDRMVMAREFWSAGFDQIEFTAHDEDGEFSHCGVCEAPLTWGMVPALGFNY